MSEVPERLRPALARLASGEASANVGLMHLLIEAASRDEAAAALESALASASSDGPVRTRLQAARDLLAACPDAFGTVKAVMAEARHDRPASAGAGELEHWSGVFDRLAEVAPEAGSALYGLGSPALLARATAEIVARLREWALVGPDRDVLEIGCGSGRIVEALAPLARSVTATDISGGMVARARERCAGHPNATVRQGDGRNLSAFPDRSFDLVLAVDVFPYLVQAGGGLARRHVDEAARVLRPGGALAILNYSYRGDREADRREVIDLFGSVDLAAERDGTRDFAWWDGSTFLGCKPA